MSKRRRVMSPVAAALITDLAAKSAPVYSDRSKQILARVAESKTTVTSSSLRTAVREAASVLKSQAGADTYLVQLIRAGWSLNGSYYSAEVLKRDGPAAWPRGTLNYVDHDTEIEEDARPSGSLMRLASYQVDDARWDDERQALVASVRVFAPWQEAVASWAESGAIGMSIRAWVYGEHGEAAGRSGFLVTGIPEGRSCDYVTVPAAGGAILSAVVESMQRRRSTTEARNIGAWLESRLHLALTQLGDDMYGDGRLTRDERITLSSAIGDALAAYTSRVEQEQPQLYQRDLWSYPEPAASPAEEARRAAEATVEERRTALGHAIAAAHGDEQTYTWVRDFDLDESLVWYDTCPSDGDNTTWQQGFTIADDGAVTLDGEPTAVVARTVYDPAPADAMDAMDATAGDTTAEAAPPETPGPAATAATEDVTDGAPPTVTDPPNTQEEETGMSGTQTGAPPVQAGTAPVVDTPPTAPAAPTSEAANAAVLEAMQALTRQVTALTEANATLTDRANRRDAEARTARNRHTAREAVTAALSADTMPADLRHQISPRVTASVLADIPVGESGDVDTVRLGEAITAAITAESGYAAQLLESAGVGRPSGLGSVAVQPQSGDDFVAEMAKSFEAIGMDAKSARIAAVGRG